MSPSNTPMRIDSPRICNVLRRSVVFPAPGEDIKFTAQTPDAASRLPLSSATRSFSERRFSSMAILVSPVWAYPE